MFFLLIAGRKEDSAMKLFKIPEWFGAVASNGHLWKELKFGKSSVFGAWKWRMAQTQLHRQNPESPLSLYDLLRLYRCIRA